MKLFLSLVISIGILITPFIFFAREDLSPTEKIQAQREYRKLFEVVEDCEHYASRFMEVAILRDRKMSVNNIMANLTAKINSTAYTQKNNLIKKKKNLELIYSGANNKKPLEIFNQFFTECISQYLKDTREAPKKS